ncbi:SseB family protein [Micromonospora sp. WMMD1082]|uniref:SseB family protein n=1 Tax=Micromonospora sp. WMMD1082 TaxID=3016104 RepID=UPI002417309B|nr:SseB family protein [Micromonospora sp. WMMD1082]MDG4795342.1 SseB family protein [Micromonospora sp. WMMD1082]
MTDWEPATEAEAALRDALRGSDQQLYFRILASIELLLPVSAQAAAGRAPVGWGTWTTGGRTHVLAFTSAEAMRACLGEHAGPSRRTGYAELAAGWPNHEWWLAVNPGLPVEGYLPAWYVSQLSRGDVRLPGRTAGARARLERVEALNRSREVGLGVPPPAAPTPPAAPPPVPPVPAATVAPEPRPPGLRPGRPAAPAPAPPVVPAAFHLPEVPAVTPGAVGGPHRQPPLSRAPGHPAPAVPDSVPSSDGSRPGADVGRPAGRGGLPPRRPVPGRGDEPPAPGQGWPMTPERSRPPANGRPAESGGEQTGHRSFFEPAAGRSARGADRSAERAAPPSRFPGGQPFPRRGSAGGPASEGQPRAFVFTENDQSTARPEPGAEAHPPLPPPDGSARPLRVSTPAGWAAPDGGNPTAGGGEAAPGLPVRRPTDGAEEEPSPSVAETLSEPPTPRRGFTPIVIEGTIIEARDLTLANGAAQRPQQPGGETTAHGPGGTATRAGVPPLHPAPEGTGAAADPRVEPAPGPTSEPTVRIPTAGSAPTAESAPTVAAQTAAPSVAARTAEPSVAARTARAEPTVPFPTAIPEPTVPVATAAPEPTIPLRAAAPEPTVAVRTVTAEPATAPGAPSGVPPAGTAEATTPTAPSASAEPTTPTAAPAPAGTTTPPTAGAPEAPLPSAPVSSGRAPSSAATAAPAAAPPFEPANGVEEDLLGAADAGNTDTFLSTLLLARVLMPVAADSAPGSRPGDPGFVWPTVDLDGQTFVVVFTSPQRLADHTDPAAETVQVRFVQLIRRWPDTSWWFAVNPGTPVGAKLPGEQIVGLANWAAELGLGDETEGEPEPPAEATAPASSPRKAGPAADPARPIVMQKAIAPSQLGYYLERGYDRVSGFVHRASELAHLTTPATLYQALGLSHPQSPFAPDAEQIYVLRWPAYRPSLYRIPYGGQSEAAMRAMEGWVIERPPFRGNGFAPGESSDVLAEFKVDSVRLPHGAQLLCLDAAGTERLVAVLDADTLSWREVGER